MKTIFSATLILMISITTISAQFECTTPDDYDPTRGILCFNNSISTMPNSGCTNFERYAPLIPEHTPVKLLQLVFHIFRDDNGLNNFQNTPTDIGYLEDIIETLNIMWGNLPPLSGPNPICLPEPIQDTRIRFQLEETFFWNDSDAWCESSYSPWCSFYEYYVTNNINLTSDQKDNSLHVFIKGPQNCNTGINNFPNGGFSAGIPVNNEKFILIGGIYNTGIVNNQPWAFSQTGSHAIPAVFTHEIGHALGLIHSNSNDFCCDTEMTTCSSYMDLLCTGGGFDGAGFSECQIARMHYLLEDSNHCGINGQCTDISDFVITDYCTKDPNYTITIQNGESIVWDVDKKLNTDVEIQAGGELIIRCTIGMPTLGSFRVRKGARLIIDGGIITHNRTLWDACDSGIPQNEKWGGIRVYGAPSVTHTNQMLDESYVLSASDPGVVIIKNGATLEYAKNAISTAQYLAEGGIVYAKESYFINNNRSAELANYPFTNLSSFTDCEFLNIDGYGWAGVTTWGTKGILFDGCIFRGFTNVGVSGNRARLTFKKCIFEANHHGLRSANVSPLDGNFQIGTSSIDDANIFRNNYVGAYNISSDRFLVQNNYFEDNLFGVAATGQSHFLIQYNTFHTTIHGNNIGIDLEQTANLYNSSECNEFTGTMLAGIDATGNNVPFRFLNEDFQTVYDVIVSEINNGSGTPVAIGDIGIQGAPGNSAWNYFSNNFANDFHINTIGSTNFFEYYYPINPPDTRLEPECDISGGTGCPITNYYEKNPTFGNVIDCPDGIPPGGVPCAEITKDCYENVRDTVLYYEGQIANGNNGIQMLSSLELWRTRKNFIFRELVYNWIDSNEYEEIETFLIEENTDQSKRFHIGLNFLQKDHTSAQILIQNYPTDTGDNQNFKAVQEINLVWQTSGESFTLSPEQEATLVNIVASKTPSSGYAKSMLSILNNDIFDPELPDLLHERSSNDTETDKIGNSSFSVTPNPSSNLIQITVPSRKESERGILSIFDMQGRIKNKTIVTTGQSVTINVQGWDEGIYIASLRLGSGIEQHIRFVVMN